MDRNIDFKYKQHYQTHIAPSIAADTDIPSQSIDEAESEGDNFLHVVQYGREYNQPKTDYTEIDELLEELENQSLEYIPAVEEKPILISKLPSKENTKTIRGGVVGIRSC
jgi:F-box protein 9